MRQDASILRDIIARECDTVNEYEALAERAASESVRQLVLHLAAEEKEHIAECTRLLAQVDPLFAELMSKPLTHALGDLAPAPPPPVAPPVTPPSPAAALPPPESAPLSFTIGSLIRKGSTPPGPGPQR